MALSKEERLAKNKRIKEAGKATRDRRAKMDCRTYTTKLYPNFKTTRRLELLFREAKWVRNHLVANGLFTLEDLRKVSKTVPVKTPSGFENREITILPAKVLQSVLQQVKQDLSSLKARKKKGMKVGALKPVCEVRSLNLSKHGYIGDYRIDFERNKVRLPKMGWVKTRGLHQLEGCKEIANAKLLRNADGFYLAITVYFDKGEKEIKFEKGTEIGVDLGVKTHVTLSNGEELSCTVRETERMKRLQRKLSRQTKGSKNYNKTLQQVKREYLTMDNQKADFANKIVHKLLGYETVYFQDESLIAWRNNKRAKFGKSLQHSALGQIKQKLVNHSRAVMLDKFVPTTQYCPVCKKNTKHGLGISVYQCDSCNYTANRDVHAAKNMIVLGKQQK